MGSAEALEELYRTTDYRKSARASLECYRILLKSLTYKRKPKPGTLQEW
jgi:hypothetical protein